MHDFLLTGGFLQPGMILIFCGLLCLLVPQTLRRILVLAGPVLCLGAVLCSSGDKLTTMFALIFSIISLIAALYNLSVKDRYETAAETVYAGASISAVFAAGWISMIVYWEIMAVSSWLVVISARTRASRKAGFRYLMVHILGGNLLLAGIAILLSEGSFMVESLAARTPDAAYWLILAGVAVNAAIPPLHAWIADSYPESTMGGTVYMGSFTTKVGVFFLIKLFAGTELLLYFGVFMAVFGACMALIENDLRRLFAYHIVSQVGYMVAAVALGGPLGIDGAAAHAFNNILYKGTLLMCAGTVISCTGKRKISQLGGLGKKMPLTAACFFVASLAIAGFPLLNGFVSKSLIMNAAAESGIHWAELLLMAASVGTLLSITLKINYFVFWGKTDSPQASLNADGSPVSEASVPWSRKMAMVLGAAGCILCGIFPKLVYSLTPYGSDGHPFTVDHVTQYLELFAAAGIAFILYLPKMKPHEQLTLDVDWLYRKPLKALIQWMSRSVDGIRCSLGRNTGLLIQKGNRYLQRPELLLQNLTGRKPRKKRNCLEDDDVLQKPAGWLVAVNFIVFLAVVLFVFYNM